MKASPTYSLQPDKSVYLHVYLTLFGFGWFRTIDFELSDLIIL